MKSVLVIIASLTFAIAPFLTPEFGGFDPDSYPIPQENSPVLPAGWAFAIWGTIIADMPACMLVTADENVLRARPLAPFVDKQSRTIQFVTDDNSAKVEELLKHHELCLTFADTISTG